MSDNALAETVSEFPVPANCHAVTVISVTHYTERLFAFRVTRPQSFRFRSGEFVMIGLPNSAKPVFRAYSIASPSWDEEIEFYSIKVPDGPLTSELVKIKPGDTVLMRQKSTGTLVFDALLPGKRLFMFATGTGIAPFASIVRDPDAYEKFEHLYLLHTCRQEAELTYGKELVAACHTDPLIGEFAGEALTHYATTTREPSERMGRITTLISNGKFYEDLGIEPLNPETDRIMICGSMAMLKEIKALAESLGFTEGSVSLPGQFVVERAFVD